MDARMDSFDARMDSFDARIDSADVHIHARMDSIDSGLNDHVTQSSFVLQCAKYASLHNIEDWALTRIKRIANLSSQTTHRETIDHFLRKYVAYDISREYLLSLRNFSVREIVIRHIHMPSDDADLANIMWYSISRMLNEEERNKYRALMRFGRGLTLVERKK